MIPVTTWLTCHYNHDQDRKTNSSPIIPTSFDSLSNQGIQSVLHLDPINHCDETNGSPTWWILKAKYLTSESWSMKWPAYMNPHPSTQRQCCSHHKNNKSSILTSLPNKKLHRRHNNKTARPPISPASVIVYRSDFDPYSGYSNNPFCCTCMFQKILG